MKGLRVAAFGLVVGLCLVSAAPAAAVDGGAMRGRAVAGGAAEWIAGWVETVAAWLGWGEEEGLRKAVAATSSCIDPSGPGKPCPTGGAPVGPAPSTDDDTGSCIDPNGNRVPCTP